MDRYDVVIVGARCAGSPLATLLARRGLDVCVLDQARFPSDTLSTHIVQPHGVGLLGQLCALAGLDDAIRLYRVTLVNDDLRIEADLDADDTPGLCVRRVTLDAVLLETASDAGARVRTRTKVTGTIESGGRVVGVETVDGPVHARLVVGADGRRSDVARWVGARDYHGAPGGRMCAYGYFEGADDQEGRLRIGQIGDYGFLAAPADGGLFMSAITLDLRLAPDFLADRDARFAAALREWPELGAVVEGHPRAGPLRVLTEWHGYFRESAGPGWALVGDAGHFKDFTPGQGIADALRQSERLAGEIVAGMRGDDAGLDERLERWWRWRDEDAWEMYWLAADMGAPGPPTPLVTRVLRDVARRPDGARDLFRVFDHELRPSELFTRPLLVAAAARALVDRPSMFRETVREAAAAAREQVRRDRVRGTRR